jgi:hypothetical protein
MSKKTRVITNEDLGYIANLRHVANLIHTALSFLSSVEGKDKQSEEGLKECHQDLEKSLASINNELLRNKISQ